ncbi:DinB family protein [Solicola gregarius]|uniref:DinB family protein n=1 Tax=Solicola gregarius TaxID=2908642 RepID=A0AA46YJ43_9ACTN|nr:DinB family protein [Solicola gregarius]UYM03837.1 DinB family protein [Solicola gregarius]
MRFLPEPSDQLSDPAELLPAYLDFYRSTLLAKLDGLSDDDLRRSILPSGWTPLELLKHLTYVERRWLVWGFEAEPVDAPWGDHDPDTERWHVDADETLHGLRAEFLDQCERSRSIVAAADLGDRASVGGRFATVDEAPYLSWILFHLVQEYARHVGHLDVVRELLDGSTGE